MDVFSRRERSRIMSRIRSQGNAGTELRLIKLFQSNKIVGWRRNQKLFGKPDFVFPKKRLVVFVDGCFWHGCPRCYRRPRSNLKYWDTKIFRNRKRDRKVKSVLKKLGWRVVRIWAHELKTPNRCVQKLLRISAPPAFIRFQRGKLR
ncbi:MAG: very short patch repair endonuclease [Limisphaerales bacterium]